MQENPLGKRIEYQNKYSPSLLFPIKREINRKIIGIRDINFSGYDVWNCYEFSFLNNKGLPLNYILKIVYDANSENIVESKSLKLYLGSFGMTNFENIEEAIILIKKDLTTILKTEKVIIKYYDWNYKFKYSKISEKYLIDKQEVKIEEYNLDSTILQIKRIKESKRVIQFSNLLKTNCPVTGQPDWATLYVEYKSTNIVTEESLLKYIVSFREHKDYHESVCEKIMFDMINITKPEYLIVKSFFTRRGGIDINPCRFYNIKADNNYEFHYWRQ